MQLFVIPSLFAQYDEKAISSTIYVSKIEKQQKYYIITALDGDEYIVIVSKRHKKINNSVKLTPCNYYFLHLVPCLENDVVPTMGLRYVIRINGDEVKVPLRGRNIYVVPNLFGLFLSIRTD